MACTNPLVNDECTVLLIHSNHAHGSHLFTDSGAGPNCPHVVSGHGDARHDIDAPKFCASSLEFFTPSDWLSLDDHADWYFGSDDFTVDLWMMRRWLGVRQFPIGQCAASGAANTVSFRFEIQVNNTIRFSVASGAAMYNATSTGTIADIDTWHHIAGVRDGNTLRLFIDGVADGTVDVTGVTLNNSINQMAIGRMGEYPGYTFFGHIDEVRISKGVARWVANFTPPTAPYEDICPAPWASLSGTVKEKGVAVARTVRAYNRATGALFSSGASGGDGNFSIDAPDDTTEMYVIALDDDPGEQYNALIYDRVKGV